MDKSYDTFTDKSDKSDRSRSSFRALPALRGQVGPISDGGSKVISSSVRAQSFTSTRAENHNDYASDTYIASLIDDLQMSLQMLHITPESKQLEEWATLIHECLSGDSRQFHSVHHVFEISAGSDPIQLLGACFRDSVNCVTDGDLNARQASLIGSILTDNYVLNAPTDAADDLVMDLFGLKEGQDVSQYKGLDIFLSAILMTRVLKQHLSPTILVQILVCMEATIPFRRPDKDGKTALDTLYYRLLAASAKYELTLSEEELTEALQRAADLNNRNLGNFASEDAIFFLDHTWSLLPERSAALRRCYLYSVNDMVLACREMETFLTNLDVAVVFSSFRGVPNEEEMVFFQQRLNANQEKGCKYMRAVLISITLISAVATLTGGDGPMSFFTGDLPTLEYQSNRLGEDLPAFEYKELHNFCDRDVYTILEQGRQMEQSFDTRNAPIAAYLYARLGDDGVAHALGECEFPMTPESSRKLLQHLPRQDVELIARDIGQIAVSRTETVDQLLAGLFE